MKKPLITDIQKYSIHDGPGIRTTVFFKGCPLHCNWCHNPETQHYSKELYYDRHRCTRCGRCVKNCPTKAISISDQVVNTNLTLCTGCMSCMEYCLQGAREFVGRYIEPVKLISELKKDTVFYEESGGGITFSGGEVMSMDMGYLAQVMEPLHNQGYHLGIDTCGHVEFEQFTKIMNYADFFLYDLKIIDSKKHEYYTGVPNERILENLKRLSDDKAAIYLRIPVIHGVNATLEEMEKMAAYLRVNNIKLIQIHLIPYHAMGKIKYDKLRMHYKEGGFFTPTQEELDEISQLFVKHGYRTVIGG